MLLSGSPTAYTVDTAGDTGTGSGNSGDLRFVVNLANMNTTNPAGSLIQFDPTRFGQIADITLTSTLELSETIGPEVIEGPGLPSTLGLGSPSSPGILVIEGNGNFGDFVVDSNVTATLSGLIITSGSAAVDGGGIDNNGTLTITASDIEDNQAAGNGGGISNSGTLTVTDSLISNNSSTNLGGGISNSGAVAIAASSIQGNTADSDGGGIANGGLLDISNVTITGNSALNGGGIANIGKLTAVNITITGNNAGNGVSGEGGGIDNGGDATLDNTIVALNTVNDTTASDINGQVSSDSSFNLIGSGGSGGLSGFFNGNQVGVADPGLGNPISFSFLGQVFVPLLAGSPAIDMGNNALAIDPSTGQALTTDERGAGFVRIFNGTVDIGADELQPQLVATAEPPASVASGAPFGMTVTIFEQSGQVDTGFNGNVTLALVNPGGATLGGTLTVAAQSGVATFTGLTINRSGKYRIMASTDTVITALTTPVAVFAPPMIVTEKVLFAGKGRRRHVVGFELDFSAALDPGRAVSLVEYALTQTLRHGQKLIAKPVVFGTAYDATAHSVTLTLTGRPKFTKGGRLVVLAAPPGGIIDASGVPLDGGNQGVVGDDGTFVIAPKGTAISR